MNRELHRWLARASSLLADAGVPSPRHDAEELAAYSHGVDRHELWRVSTPDEKFWSYVERRRSREPLQHNTGRAHFRRLTLAVGPGVFVPRPETEVVAGAAIEGARRVGTKGRVPRVVDLGTGSGAIALSVVTEVPHAHVYAVEAHPTAYEWAARNLRGSGVDVRRGDMADAFTDLDGTADVVVSNPPYIPLAAEPLEPEVRDHDPASALWSGEDGLDAMRVVERVGARLLRMGGLLVAEHGDRQGDDVVALLPAGAWADVSDHVDLAGRPRFVTARRR